MTAPRIDTLQTGDRIVLQLPAGITHATFIMHNGEGEDRTATFSTSDPESNAPNVWDAYRHKKRWCYGTAQTPLKVLGRALPTLTVGDTLKGKLTPERLADLTQPDTGERIMQQEYPSADEIAQAMVLIDVDGLPDEAVEAIEETLNGGLHNRPFDSPNPTCACGHPAFVILDPTNLPNLAVCEDCAEAIRDGS